MEVGYERIDPFALIDTIFSFMQRIRDQIFHKLHKRIKFELPALKLPNLTKPSWLQSNDHLLSRKTLTQLR